MRKQEFLDELRKGLAALPQSDIEERLNFYSEMIDDRTEEGLSEEDAVSAIGSVDSVVEQILSDTPFTKIVKEKIRPKRALKAWETVLLVLGSPVWLSLLIAAVAVVIAIYAALWAVIVSLWACVAALFGGAVGGIASGIGFICGGEPLSGVVLIGASLASAGFGILLFFGCKAVTKGTVTLTKRVLLRVKNRISKKEGAK